MSAVLALTVALPLTGAALLAIVGLWLPARGCELIALLVAVATAALCLVLLAGVGSGLEVHWFGGWRPRDGVAIGVAFAADALGAGLAAFVALLTVLALAFTMREGDRDQPYFQVIVLAFMAAMVGFALSADLFNLFVFFELMSVAAFALVGYRSERRAPLEGALNFAVTNTVGSFVLLCGLALVYGRTGALNLAQIGETLARQPPDGLVVVAFALLAAGLFVKAAVMPFGFWLADAYAVAPASVGLLLAGAMSEMGLFGVARLYHTAFAGAFAGHEEALRAILVGAGALTALWGALMALRQDHLGRLLAFVTMSYVGVFLCGIALLSADGLAGAAIYVIADGCAKAGLFGVLGIVEHRCGEVGIGRLHGRLAWLRWTGALWFALAALTALPPFGAFLAKAAIDDAALAAGYDLLPALLAIVVALNAGALLAAGARVFGGWGERPEPDPPRYGDAPAEGDRTPASMFAPVLLLAAAAAAIGLFPGVGDAALTGAQRFAERGAYAAAILDGRAPGALAALAPGPRWFDYLYGAGAVLGALVVAATALWGRRTAAGTAVLRAGAALARPLAALHSGRVGDYTAWLALGAGALAGLMALAR